MKNRLFKIFGIIVVVFTLVANLQYALSDYGLSTHNLGSPLMAQAATATSVSEVDYADDDTSTSGGVISAHCYDSDTEMCGWELTDGVYSTCTFSGHYGSPTTCEAYGCAYLGVQSHTSYRCVKRSS